MDASNRWKMKGFRKRMKKAGSQCLEATGY